MSNNYFRFKEFIIQQDHCAMKVTTDACLFGSWVVNEIARSLRNGAQLKDKTALDVGGGTGLLSLMMAQKFPDLSIDVIEVDADAFTQAKDNVEASAFAKKINLLYGDARTFNFSKKYDIIISNPPFYESEIKSDNQKKNIARHHSGLILGELLEIIEVNLSHDGSFYVLLPFKRYEEIRKMLMQRRLSVSKIVFIRQSIKHGYFRLMLAGKLKMDDEETQVEEISICNDRQQYTDEFIHLLKDYYLNL